MIFGDVDFYVVGRTGFHLTKDVVGDTQRRNRETVSVKVERVFVVRKRVISFVRRVGWQVVD